MAVRELSVVYNAFTIGGGTAREITDVMINTKRFEQFVIEVTFKISQTSESAFATEIAAVEDAFSTPFGDLEVTQGASPLYSFLQSDNTGLDAQPEITKRRDAATGRSREYTVRVTVGLPADTGNELAVGLREHNVEVRFDASRIRTVSITGTYTASGGSDARAQFESTISALESSVLSALGINASNRELAEEPQSDHTYNTKTLEFRRVFKELVFSQGGASNDDAGLVGQSLRISRLRIAPGDAPNVARLATLVVNYETAVDKDVTTDLRSKYDSIRAFIITQARNTLGTGTIALVDEEPEFDYDANRFRVRMLVQAIVGAQAIEWILTIEDNLQIGTVLVPVWNDNPLSRYKYNGPATRRRTLTQTKRVAGFIHSNPGSQSDGGLSDITEAGISGVSNPGGLSVHHLDSKRQYIHRRIGRAGDQFDVTDIVQTDIYEFAEIVSGGDTPSENPFTPQMESRSGGAGGVSGGGSD